MDEDRRRFPCPVCGRGFVQIGKQCGFCRKFCTEARGREAERRRAEPGASDRKKEGRKK